MAYREAMQEAGRCPVSINKALSAIRRLATEAADQGALPHEIAARIESVPQVERRGKKLGNWLTLDDLRKLLTAAPPTTPNRGCRDRAALSIMGLCGLRRQEAADLRRWQFQERDGRAVLVDVLGKGSKLRSVPVHDVAAASIRAWLDRGAIDDPEGYILPAIDNPDRVTGRKCAADSLYQACMRYCAALDLQFRPHDLRRTFALLARKGGADYESIRQALGHSSITTTEIYVGQALDLENAAADRIKL